MSDPIIPIGLLDTIIAIVSGIIITLIGIIYRKLNRRIDELEAEVDAQREEIAELQQDVEIAYSWMFGREADPTNGGVAKKIEDGFDDAEMKLETLEDRFKELTDQLIEDNNVDIDRRSLDD